MALTKTLLDMRTAAKQRAHMENGGPLDDSEWDDNINANIRALYRLLAQAYGAEYFKKSTTLTTTSGEKSIALPGDFFKLISVWWTVSDGIKIRLRRATEQEMERETFGMGWPPWAFGMRTDDEIWPKYALRASGIEFTATPTAEYSITFNYVGAPLRLTLDEDTFDGYGGFEEFVIWMTAADAIAKEEGDTTHCIGRANGIAMDITTTAERDQSEPLCIQDTVPWMGE